MPRSALAPRTYRDWFAGAFTRDDLSPDRLAALPKIAAGGMLVLMGATLPLWTPQDVFPQVPWFSAWVDAPAWLDGLGATLLAAALFVVLLAPSGGRAARYATIATPVLWLAVLAYDQHRLQPWAYQGLLLSVFALARPETAAACARGLVASIYVFSALSKFDVTFLEKMGPEFFHGFGLAAAAALRGIAAFVPGLDFLRGWADGLASPNAAWLAATAGGPSLLFPLGELAVGVLLCFPNCRRAALVGIAFLHGGLLIALGPWGLDHSAGVVVWNLWFLLFDFTLFSPRLREATPAPAVEDSREIRGIGDRLAVATAAAAVLAPLGEPWGFCDAWPAWALYAPRNERVELLVQTNVARGWPREVGRFLEPTRDGLGESRIKLNAWSLAVLRVPLYPSIRFQYGATLALVDQDTPPQTMRLAIGEAADRWTGRRRERVVGLERLATSRSTYFFNFRPRGNVRWTNPGPLNKPNAAL